MSGAFKRISAEIAAPGRTEYFSFGQSYQLDLSRSAYLDNPLVAKEGAAAVQSVIVSAVPSSEASSASDLGIGAKAAPFGLPCITDEKLLMLMAQGSVNGRLDALQASDSPIGDEPAAVPIAVGGSVTGVIDVTGDTDDVTVTLVAGQRYMISLMGTGAGALADSYLQIFDPSMVSLGHDDDGGVGRNSVITITAAVSGTYTIRASAFGTSGVGQYTVDVRQMGTDSVPATIGGAVPIVQGITFGFRETVGDTDYYKVSLVAGTSYSFSVAAGTDYQTSFNPIPAGEFDTYIVLRGPTGAILTQNDDISWPSDASSSFQFQATATGDYYLEVTGLTHSAAPGGNTGGYVIDFHEVPPPDPLESLDWGTAANIPTVMVDGVPTAYVYFAAAGENFGENAQPGDPSQPASGGNGTLVSHGWTEYEKAQFMLAMQEYTKLLGIAYVETTNSAVATFRVITNSSNVYGAYAYPQDPAYGNRQGIMVFNVDNRGWDLDSADPAVTTDGLGRGGYAWHTILHEAGHAHGLAHPHDTGGGSQVMVGVTSPDSLGAFNLNQGVYTQMSYNGGWQTHPDGGLTNGDPTGWRSDAGWLATMGAFDIAVLQARYGVVPAFATGDNVYTLLDVNAEGTYLETIYDTGGIDTIAYNGARGAQIDLNTATLDYSVTGGGIVSFVRNLPGQTTAQAIKGGFTIANGVVIENATGGSGNDVLIGNAAANVLTGNAGNDVFMAGGGDDNVIGGDGSDVFLFGAAMTGLDRVDGGAGTDQIALQGDYAGAKALTFGLEVVGIENLAILHGSDTRFGDPGTNFYDYNFTTRDINVAAGVQMIVDANRLRLGEDFTFNGASETDGSFFIFGGGGVDLLTGGALNDVFLFGAGGQWGATDVINGGPGGIDQLALRGNYTLTFGAGQLVGIENIGLLSAHDTRFGVLGSSYSYNLNMVDANVASGVQMTVDGARLRIAETFSFNGSAETDGSFRVFGGLVDDIVAGSQNADLIQGNGGADTLTGNGGADIFRYLATGDSTASAMDRILDFASGTDKIDLSRIDADTLTAGDQAFSWIGSNAFGGSAGQLRAFQQGGDWILEGDTDGNGSADFVVLVTVVGPTPLSAGEFFL